MIRYSLRCAAGHVFDAWFRDSAAFDAQAASGRVACAVCGQPRVEKAIMAPAVTASDRAARPDPAAQPPNAAPPGAPSGAPSGPAAAPGVPAPAAPPLSAAPTPAERALAKLRQYLSDKADYVGRGFAAEARRIHEGEADDRAIWGEATPEDAEALRDEGIPVAPLPWLSRRDD